MIRPVMSYSAAHVTANKSVTFGNQHRQDNSLANPQQDFVTFGAINTTPKPVVLGQPIKTMPKTGK